MSETTFKIAKGYVARLCILKLKLDKPNHGE